MAIQQSISIMMMITMIYFHDKKLKQSIDRIVMSDIQYEVMDAKDSIVYKYILSIIKTTDYHYSC